MTSESCTTAGSRRSTATRSCASPTASSPPLIRSVRRHPWPQWPGVFSS